MNRRFLAQHFQTILYSVIALANLAFLLGALFFVMARPSAGFLYGRFGDIDFIYPQGAAIGLLQNDDHILSVNGIPSGNLNFLAAYDKFLRQEPAIILNIKRSQSATNITNLHTITIPVVPPTWREYVTRSSFYVVALSFWVASILPLFYRSDSRSRHIFFFFCQIWMIFMVIVGEGFFISKLFGIRGWAIVQYLIPIWAVVLFNHFHLVFPRPLFHKRLRQAWVALLYTIVIGITIAVFINPPAIDSNRLWGLMEYGIIYGALGGLGLLAYSYIKTPPPSEQRAFGFIILGATVGLLPVLILSSVPASLSLDIIFPSAFTIYPLAILPLMYAYAMRRYQVIKFERYATRSSVLFITVLLLAGFYLMGYALVIRLFSDEVAASLPAGLSLALATALVYRPLRARVQIWAEKMLLGGWYDYQTVVERVIADVANVEGEAALAKQLTTTVQEAMHLKWVALFLPDGDGAVKTAGLAGERKLQDAFSSFQLDEDAAIMRFFKDKTKPYSAEEVKLATPQRTSAETNLLNYPALRLLTSVQSRQDEYGIMALGPKVSGDVFGERDLNILFTVIWQSSAVLQNAYLVRELKKELAEGEQYQRQYLHIRREEQKRLARELHDRVVQDLVGLKYQAIKWQNNDTLPAPLSQQMATFADKTGELIATTRVLCRNVRPPALNLGFLSAIRSLVNTLEEQRGMQIDLRVAGDRSLEICEDSADCLYQCIQEALINVHKHAHLPHASLSLTLQEDSVTVVIEDDGPGFTMPERLAHLMQDNHFGLMGMRERVELEGGSFILESSPQKGTHIELNVPPAGFHEDHSPTIIQRLLARKSLG